MKGGETLPEPYEILVLEVNENDEKRYALGYCDLQEILHEMNPNISTKNYKCINKKNVTNWINLKDAVRLFGKEMFSKKNDVKQVFEF